MEQEIENWKDVIGFEGLYQVSDLGRVKSIKKGWMAGNNSYRKTNEYFIKSNAHNKDGYHRMFIYKEAKLTVILLSRLVAIHFIPNPENKEQVNHKFGNKDDNRAISLEWNTQSENQLHANRMGLKPSFKGGRNPAAKIVLDLQTGIFYDCAKDAAESKNINHHLLCAKLNGGKRNNTSFKYV